LAERDSELNTVRQRLSELEAQLSERDSSMAAQSSTIAEQEQSLREVSERARSSDTDLELRGNELGEVRAAAEAASLSLAERESELVGLKEQIAVNAEELAQTRTALERQRDELGAQIPELEAGIGERDQRLKDLEAEIVTAAGKAGDIDAKDQQLNELSGQLERAEAKAGALNESLLEQEGSLDERQQRIDALLDDLAQKDQSIGGVSAEAAAAAQRCEKLEAELNGAQTTVTGLEANAAERELAAHAEVAELQRLIGERTAELQELQTQIASRSEAPEQGDVGEAGEGDERRVARELDDSKRQVTLLEREQGRQQKTMQVLSQQLDDARQTHARLSETIAERDTRIAVLESGSPAKAEAETPQPGLLLSSRPDDCDDLQRISGIGAALEKALNELGIYRLRQIAALNETDIKWVDGNLRGFKGRIIRDAWVEQADALSFGG
jgi:predicted flap endonuclease-1-like 5' DNA nuclease